MNHVAHGTSREVHLVWGRDHTAWLEDVRVWKSAQEAVLARWGQVERALRAHYAAIDAHCQAVQEHGALLAEHEIEIEGEQRSGRCGEGGPMSQLHDVKGAAHAGQRRNHEDLRARQLALVDLMAKLQTVLTRD